MRRTYKVIKPASAIFLSPGSLGVQFQVVYVGLQQPTDSGSFFIIKIRGYVIVQGRTIGYCSKLVTY